MTEAFEKALAAIPDGYTTGFFGGRRWGTTVKRSADQKRVWLFAEEIGGKDFVSFNAYRLTSKGLDLKPCEMSSDKVIAFVLGYRLNEASSQIKGS